VFRVQPATLDVRVVPGCPPGPLWSAVTEVGLELPPDDVGEAALQGPEGFFAGLPFAILRR
jgi:hypothetical protein